MATSLINWVCVQSPKSIIPLMLGTFKSSETMILLSLISLCIIDFLSCLYFSSWCLKLDMSFLTTFLFEMSISFMYFSVHKKFCKSQSNFSLKYPFLTFFNSFKILAETSPSSNLSDLLMGFTFDHNLPSIQLFILKNLRLLSLSWKDPRTLPFKVGVLLEVFLFFLSEWRISIWNLTNSLSVFLG